MNCARSLPTIKKMALLGRIYLLVISELRHQRASLFQTLTLSSKIWKEHIWKALSQPSDRGYSASKDSFRHVDRIYWHPDIPGYPSAAFERVVSQLVSSELDSFAGQKLMMAIFAFTKRCSLGCEHCFEGDALNGEGELPVEKAKRILDKLVDSGVGQIVLSGGEPLNRFGDLICLVEYLKEEPVDVWINTSGVSLSSSRAEQLCEAGLTGVTISLDDHRPEYHDRFRGRSGIFERVETAFASARNAGLLTKATLCAMPGFISNENLESYCSLVNDWQVDFWQILEPKGVGRYVNLPVELSNEQKEILERFYLANCNSSGARIRAPIMTYPDFDRRRHGCLGGKHYIYVNTDGMVSPCPFCQQNGQPIESIGSHNQSCSISCASLTS